MPTLYLSPSTQEWNPYAGGGNEEQYMNLVADDMMPYLRACAISVTRNTPEMTAASSIVQSNAGHYGLHLALHSNASPASSAGQRRGAEVYYARGAVAGLRAAELIAANLREIYPGDVHVLATTTLGEVVRTRAPAVLIEYAYHDNAEDAEWIRSNIPEIAQATAKAVAQFFGLPFADPINPPAHGRVKTKGSALLLRAKPDRTTAVIGRLANGQPVTLYGEWKGWVSVESSGLLGWVDGRYLAR